VPEKETIPLEMSVEDGMKAVISAGVITPNWKPPVENATIPKDEQA